MKAYPFEELLSPFPNTLLLDTLSTVGRMIRFFHCFQKAFGTSEKDNQQIDNDFESFKGQDIEEKRTGSGM